MTAKKNEKRSHHKKPELLVPFPAERFPDEPPKVLEETPPGTPVDAPEFKVGCVVTSVGTRFFSGVVFVALKATDGQDLINLLREDQAVTLVYRKPELEEQ